MGFQIRDLKHAYHVFNTANSLLRSPDAAVRKRAEEMKRLAEQYIKAHERK